MAPWWRRKRKRFAPFDRAALPEVEPLTFEESFAEGLLVAEAAGRMALKNRIIVMALRGEEPFDATRAAAAAREVLHELVRSWTRSPSGRRPSANPPTSARAVPRTSTTTTARMPGTCACASGSTPPWPSASPSCASDDAYLADFAERARQEAWAEIAGEIDAAAGPRVAGDRGRRGVRARARRPDARPDARARTGGRRRPAPARDLRRARRLVRRLAGLMRPPTYAVAGTSSATSASTRPGCRRETRTHVSRSLPAAGPRAPSPRTRLPGKIGARRRPQRGRRDTRPARPEAVDGRQRDLSGPSSSATAMARWRST